MKNQTIKPEDIRVMLSFIPADDRDTWVKMGMAIREELGNAGWPIWKEWSRKSDSYQ